MGYPNVSYSTNNSDQPTPCSKQLPPLFLMHIAGVLSYQRSKGEVLDKMGINLARTSAPLVHADDPSD